MPDEPTPKPSRASRTEMTEYVLPTHTNALGGVFGGQIMAWIDLCAAICAQRHAARPCVTAGVDDLAFDRTVRAGQIVRLSARVTAAFRTSLEVYVEVTGEDAVRGEQWPCVTAYLTFVALGPDGKPGSVPPLAVETPEDEALAREATERRRVRLERARKVIAPGAT